MREKTNELIDLLISKNPLIYVNTYEENEFIVELCNALSKINKNNRYGIPPKIYTYSRPTGLYLEDINDPLNFNPDKVDRNIKTINEVLSMVRALQYSIGKDKDEDMLSAVGKNNKKTQDSHDNDLNNRPAIFILKDLYMYFNDKDVVRMLRDCKEQYINKMYCPIIVTGSQIDIPPELEKIFTVWDFPLMTKKEIIDYLNCTLKDGNDEYTEQDIVDIASASVGLTQREIDRAIFHSMAKNLRVVGNTEVSASDINEEKIQIVKKANCLDFIEPKYNINDLGGCDNFKEWMKKVKESISPEAQEFGIPFPKGAMLVGVPGTSKSASAEIMASYLNVPLLSLQMSKVMGSFVGQSEKGIANAIRIAKAVSPCVLLLDECEKAFGGIQSSNQSDSGTLSRVMGALLGFMQEDNNVIIMMTSNDITQLPPELTRSGRIDAQWIFDLPNRYERHEIIDIYLAKNKLNVDESLHKYIDLHTENFTGAEIKSAVKDMLINCYYRIKNNPEELIKRQLTIEDVDNAINNTVTVWKSSKEKIQSFRDYSRNRYLNASKTEEEMNNDKTKFSSNFWDTIDSQDSDTHNSNIISF